MNSIEFLQDRLIDMGFDKKEFDLNIDLRNELGLDSAELVESYTIYRREVWI